MSFPFAPFNPTTPVIPATIPAPDPSPPPVARVAFYPKQSQGYHQPPPRLTVAELREVAFRNQLELYRPYITAKLDTLMTHPQPDATTAIQASFMQLVRDIAHDVDMRTQMLQWDRAHAFNSSPDPASAYVEALMDAFPVDSDAPSTPLEILSPPPFATRSTIKEVNTY